MKIDFKKRIGGPKKLGIILFLPLGFLVVATCALIFQLSYINQTPTVSPAYLAYLESARQANLQQAEVSQKPKSIIQIGKIKINKQEMADIQKAIDDGHQPWRTDPVWIVQAEGGQYGFDSGDREMMQITSCKVNSSGSVPGIIKYQVFHDGKDYIITVIQLESGENKIWTISEVEEK